METPTETKLRKEIEILLFSKMLNVSDAVIAKVRELDAGEVKRLREWIRFAPHRGDCAGRNYIGAVRQAQKCDCGHAAALADTDPEA